MHGHIAEGLTTLLKAPMTVVYSPIEGHKLNQQWRKIADADPNTAAILNLLEAGGARFKMSATDYNNALPKVIRAVRQRAVGKSLKEIIPAAGEASAQVIEALPDRATAPSASPQWAMRRWGLFVVQAIVFLKQIQVTPSGAHVRETSRGPRPRRHALCAFNNDLSTVGAAHGEGRATPGLHRVRITAGLAALHSK